LKKLAFSILIMAMIVAGCASESPVINQPPTAHIDSISPTRISFEGTVSFDGHGADLDGDIVAYQWRSSMGGELSTSASFETSDLLEGTHTIWFRVKDNNGDWSNEISAHVTVLPAGIAEPVITSFSANPGSILKGKSSTLSWGVAGKATVSIEPEIGNVGLNGTMVISPTMTTQYILTATNEVGTVTAKAEVVIVSDDLHTIELFSIAAEDGHVRRNGEVGTDPNVGDTRPSVAMQAFLSFNISQIPDKAIIKAAFLDLTTDEIYGLPFINLGNMLVYNDQYGSLGGDDFGVGPLPGAIFTISKRPIAPFSSGLLIDAVQEQVDAGSSRFQIRVQFEKYYFYNNEPDYLALGGGRPKLVIEYEY